MSIFSRDGLSLFKNNRFQKKRNEYFFKRISQKKSSSERAERRLQNEVFAEKTIKTINRFLRFERAVKKSRFRAYTVGFTQDPEKILFGRVFISHPLHAG